MFDSHAVALCYESVRLLGRKTQKADVGHSCWALEVTQPLFVVHFLLPVQSKHQTPPPHARTARDGSTLAS